MRSMLLPLFIVLSLLAGCAGQPVHNSNDYSSFDLGSFEGFSEALEESMMARDTSLFVEHFDTHQFAKRSLAAQGRAAVKELSVNSYANIMGKALKQRFRQTFSEVESARFVRLIAAESTRPDEAVSLIRINIQGGGINYWKVHLRRTENQISIVDWFNYSLGDLASRSLGRFIVQMSEAMKPGAEGADAINNYLAAARSGDSQKLLDAYEPLPDSLKNNSLLIYGRVQAAMEVSDDVYRSVLYELAPLYRKNDKLALMLVDYYIFTEEYDKAHQAVDTVTAQIGDDAGLDNLHAGIALQARDYRATITHARNGIRRENDYENNYWALLDALVYSGNYSEAVLVLNILEEGFHYQFDAKEMAKLEGYGDFSRSAAFRGWQTASSQ